MPEDLPDYMRGFTESHDWGFTPVASKPEETPTVPPEEISEVKSDVKMIRSQMNEIMQIVHEQKESVDTDVAERFRSIEKLIIPFLYKLSQSEEAYIHWPNRKPILEAQIQKILSLTRTNQSKD